MFRPLGVHGVGMLFVRPGADACRVPDGKRRRGLGRGAAAVAAGVHRFAACRLHGLLPRAWAGGQRGPPGPAVPSDKFHRTGKEDRVGYCWEPISRAEDQRSKPSPTHAVGNNL